MYGLFLHVRAFRVARKARTWGGGGSCHRAPGTYIYIYIVLSKRSAAKDAGVWRSDKEGRRVHTCIPTLPIPKHARNKLPRRAPGAGVGPRGASERRPQGLRRRRAGKPLRTVTSRPRRGTAQPHLQHRYGRMSGSLYMVSWQAHAGRPEC